MVVVAYVFRAYMVYLVRIQAHANIIGVYAEVCTVVPNPAGRDSAARNSCPHQ